MAFFAELCKGRSLNRRDICPQGTRTENGRKIEEKNIASTRVSFQDVLSHSSFWRRYGLLSRAMQNLENENTVERLLLWPNGAPDGGGGYESSDASITVHHPRNPNGTAIVICPGGGYEMLCMEAEGHGIARWLNEHGIAGIVLEYRLPQGRAFVPLVDAQRSLQMAREYSQAWHLDTNKIGILGFSAGGHLAATAATHFGNRDDDDYDVRPDFAALIYPVVSMSENAHLGSRENLLGANPSSEVIEFFSNETQISENTPPIFLAHAADDEAVSPDHSRDFYAVLRMHGVSAEYLELPSGGHGLNGYQGESWEAWKSALLAWLKKEKFLSASQPM